MPPALPTGISKGTPGQQLFLTQGARGLTPVALSQVILPCTSPGASAGSSQPIYLTTQVQTYTELKVRHPSINWKNVEALIVKWNGLLKYRIVNGFAEFFTGYPCPEYPVWPKPTEHCIKCPARPNSSPHYSGPRYVLLFPFFYCYSVNGEHVFIMCPLLIAVLFFIYWFV